MLPDRDAVTMTAPMMRAYSDLLVQTCHRRGAFAIGGMAAFIPSRRDAEVNERAFAKVREDKEREAQAGFDGSWVAHPDLVPLCAEIFDGVLGDRPNQLDRLRDDVTVTADDLLDVDATPGERTEQGLRGNVRSASSTWRRGCAATARPRIDNLMEDAATAEISRSQVWQWTFNGATLDIGRDGHPRARRADRRGGVRRAARDGRRGGLRRRPLGPARRLFVGSALREDFPDFLTLPAYRPCSPLERPDPPGRGVSALSPTTHQTPPMSTWAAEREHLRQCVVRLSALRSTTSSVVPTPGRSHTASNCLPTLRSPTSSARPSASAPAAVARGAGARRSAAFLVAEQLLHEVGLQPFLEQGEARAGADVGAQRHPTPC